jgi:hypothetical protein
MRKSGKFYRQCLATALNGTADSFNGISAGDRVVSIEAQRTARINAWRSMNVSRSLTSSAGSSSKSNDVAATTDLYVQSNENHNFTMKKRWKAAAVAGAGAGIGAGIAGSGGDGGGGGGDGGGGGGGNVNGNGSAFLEMAENDLLASTPNPLDSNCEDTAEIAAMHERRWNVASERDRVIRYGCDDTVWCGLHNKPLKHTTPTATLSLTFTLQRLPFPPPLVCLSSYRSSAHLINLKTPTSSRTTLLTCSLTQQLFAHCFRYLLFDLTHSLTHFYTHDSITTINSSTHI